MGTMIDSVMPANIGPEFTGKPAIRITVWADPAAHVFDRESSNASAAQDVFAIRQRIARGQWSVAYVSQSTEGEITAELRAAGLSWTDAAQWPRPGCYLWAADPSANIAKGSWRPAVTPLAVQDRYPGPVDYSTTHDNFPAEVAGYIDGADSRWPPGAWDRFAILADTQPPDPTRKDTTMIAVQRDTQTDIYDRNPDGSLAHWYRDNSIGENQPGYGWHYEAIPAAAH